MARNADRMKRSRGLVLDALRSVDENTIDVLVVRAGREESGAYRGGTGIARVVLKGSHSDPTPAAVIAKDAGTEGQNDPVFHAVRSMAHHLEEMAELASKIQHEARFVLEATARARVSEISHCEACGREVMNTPADRIKSGYCAADYMRWLRAGKPYRASFELNARVRAARGTGEVRLPVRVP
jgi:hypothetical protein